MMVEKQLGNPKNSRNNSVLLRVSILHLSKEHAFQTNFEISSVTCQQHMVCVDSKFFGVFVHTCLFPDMKNYTSCGILSIEIFVELSECIDKYV